MGSSRNGTFLFFRAYMDYHSDRFTDHSLLYYSDKGKLLAVLPANEKDGVLYSHQGLTYGGFVLSQGIRTMQVMEMFEATIEYLRLHHFRDWYYKQIPSCYHLCPSEEDEYALWRFGAEIVSCGVSSSLLLYISEEQYRQTINLRKLSYYKKLVRKGYSVERNAPLESFWPVLTENLLLSHNIRPVHSLEEIKRLQSSFLNNIECVVAYNDKGEVEAGTVLYKTDDVVHTQYLSASVSGKSNKAMDYLIFSLIYQLRSEGHYKMLDFGISTERNGEYLNEGLIAQKEGYGGRGVVYKQYRIRI